MKSRLLSAVFAGVLISLSSHAALVDNGGGLIYDTVLDITWAQPDNTLRSWSTANAWASGLTLGGVSGWRLPYISVAAGAGPLGFIPGPVNCSTATELACRDNELGYMFYQNLSGTLGSSILTSGDPDLALFPTLQSSITNFYWSGTEVEFNDVWYFNFNDGLNAIDDKNSGTVDSWAVHAGNVVPVPAAALLFGSGLLGLIGISIRQKAA